MKNRCITVDETIDNFGPSITCLVETHMAEEEHIEIPVWRIYRNDGTKNQKGLVVAARNIINTMSIEFCRYYEVGKMLWILSNDQKQKSQLEPFMDLKRTRH